MASTDFFIEFFSSSTAATDAFTEPFTAAAVFGKSVLKDNEGGSHGFGASSFWTRWVRSWLVNDGVRPLGRLEKLCAFALAARFAPSVGADLPLGRGAGARELLPESSKNARHLLRAYIMISVSQRRREGPLKLSSRLEILVCYCT